MRDSPQRAAYVAFARLVAPDGDAPDVEPSALEKWGWLRLTVDVGRARHCLRRHPGAHPCTDTAIDTR
jgi:hypothetical protein